MEVIGIRELKGRTSEVIRRVREQHEPVAVTFRGRIVARIVPVEQPSDRDAELASVWADLDELAAEIGARWPANVTSTEAVEEIRRVL
jgi:prevent-host-death family protein